MRTTRHLPVDGLRSVRSARRRVRRWWIGFAAIGLISGALIGPLSSPTLGAGHAVRIVDTGTYDFAFAPRSISVPVGARISWTNASVTQHNVTFASFASPTYMEPGDRYAHTFAKAGTFHYTCTLHGFSGTVVVIGTAPKPTAKPTAKPTPKPTPKPTEKPTAKPASGPTTTPGPTSPAEVPTASPSASADRSIGAIALGEVASPTPVATVDGSTSVPDVTVGSSGSTPLILLGLLVVAVVGIGALALRRR